MIPTRLRLLPNFLFELLRRALVLMRPPPVTLPTFHLVLFSYRPHYRYLYCALHSIQKHVENFDLRISVFNDSEHPFSTAELANLNQIAPGIQIRIWPKSTGWGAQQIKSIWDAYATIAATAAEDDFIMKIDSDVFFFNDRLFRLAVRSKADLIGDGHYERFQFVQGGCYLFRARAVKRINDAIALHGIDAMLSGIDVAAEDRAASFMSKSLGLRTWMTWFMMFPDELRKAGGLNFWARYKFCCLHSVSRNKELMLQAYEREIFDGNFTPAFADAINLQGQAIPSE